MMRWKMRELIDRMEDETGEKLTVREIMAQTGFANRTVQEMMGNQKVRADMIVIDIVLTWASLKLGEELTESNLIDFTLTEKSWRRPDKVKEWDCGISSRHSCSA